MRIVIIGYSGSGKSTLGKKLSEIYEIPLLHLDIISHNPGWVKKPFEEIDNSLYDFLSNNTNWVIDGNYMKHYFQERCNNADKIIFLNFNRIICFIYAYQRARQYKNKCRESAPIGCIEKFDKEFIKWLLIDGRTRKRRKSFKNIINKYPDKILVFKKRKEVNLYLKNL